jgi:hypothetical protein
MDPQSVVTPEEVRSALRELYKQDRETNLEKAMLHAFADELKPVNKRGKWNPSSIAVLMTSLLLVTVAIFLYFTFARPSI